MIYRDLMLCVERPVKEGAHVILGAGKFQIHRASGRLETQSGFIC